MWHSICIRFIGWVRVSLSKGVSMRTKFVRHRLKAVGIGLAVICLSAGTALAGPFILSGTDADDHGSASATENIDGWFFMQRAIENLAGASSLTNTSMKVVNLGSTGSTAQAAATSAFTFSTLSSAGWTFANVDGVTDLEAFFDGTGTHNVNNTSIIMMDSANNVGGGSSVAERAVFTANASVIDGFLGAGGGLFSQANGYDWVNVLLPALTAPSESSTGIALTAAGSAAFPGLTNADLSAGPYHNYFDNFGSLSVFGTSTTTQNAIIIGSAGGSVTQPDPGNVPEPGTIALLGAGLFGLGLAQRRRTKR